MKNKTIKSKESLSVKSGKTDRVLEKLDNHDKKFDRIFDKLDSHDKKLDSHNKKFDKVFEKFDIQDGKIDSLSGQVDLLACKALEHDEEFRSIREEMATKKDIREINDRLDKMIHMMEKRDQETTMISYGIHRHEDRIEKLEEDVRLLKPAFGLSLKPLKK